MHRMEVQAVFVVVVVLTFAAAKTEEPTFSGKMVTLTCPKAGTWFDSENKEVSNTEANKYTFEYTRQVQYSCKYPGDKKIEYKFYIKGRACENCFELDGVLFLIVLSVDLTATAILMIIIYRCNKKSTSDAPARTSKAPVRSGGMAPTVPSPDYETLNPNTRSAETYSTVVNRMG